MNGCKIQLALDLVNTSDALRAADAAGDAVDVLEAGTVLCLSEGLAAVRALREEFPTKPLVADLRLARAGARFAEMAFFAGADGVTVVSESPRDVVAGAVEAAQSAQGWVEIELGPDWTYDDVAWWASVGVRRIIVHRSAGVQAETDDTSRDFLRRLAGADLQGMGVTLAGGLAHGDLRHFDGCPFDLVAIGSAIVEATEPGQAARAFAAELSGTGQKV